VRSRSRAVLAIHLDLDVREEIRHALEFGQDNLAREPGEEGSRILQALPPLVRQFE
jgi:hypothetical protein